MVIGLLQSRGKRWKRGDWEKKKNNKNMLDFQVFEEYFHNIYVQTKLSPKKLCMPTGYAVASMERSLFLVVLLI